MIAATPVGFSCFAGVCCFVVRRIQHSQLTEEVHISQTVLILQETDVTPHSEKKITFKEKMGKPEKEKKKQKKMKKKKKREQREKKKAMEKEETESTATTIDL